MKNFLNYFANTPLKDVLTKSLLKSKTTKGVSDVKTWGTVNLKKLKSEDIN